MRRLGKEQKCCAPELLHSRRVSSGIAVTFDERAESKHNHQQ
jgi:hypothetical protein